MTFNDYQIATRRTVPDDLDDLLGMAVLGCAGEAGELVELLKKHRYQGRKLDTDRMVNELGDLLWYCAKLADALSVDLDDVAEYNITKLMLRYPRGFTVEDGIRKADRNK
jgi:NTP pyrophosphatase (non-canonical NTP hydrolase)